MKARFRTILTFEEMVNSLSIWDQTIGCDHCFKAWWAENATERIEDFHDIRCPLRGRRDVHEAGNE